MNGVMAGLDVTKKDTGWIAVRDYIKKPAIKQEWWHEIHKGDICELTCGFGSDAVRVIDVKMADRIPDYTGFTIPFKVALDIFEPFINAK